jgi:succinate dehydrogenase hydrophobic anchor subunit
MAFSDEFAHAWTAVGFLAVVLVAYRIVPLVFRKALPFEESTRAIWFERRQLAKRFDSYQWRKLFWFGLGMGSFQVFGGWSSRPQLVLTCVCLVSGVAGLLVWRCRQKELNPNEWVGGDQQARHSAAGDQR